MMADDPVFTMLGVAALGTGVVMVYAAYKNVPVFGKNGLITQALTTGSFANVKTLPKLFNTAPSGTKSAATIPDAILTDLHTIGHKDGRLASDIADELNKLATGDPTYNQSALDGLLSQASSEGFGAQANRIRNFVKGVHPSSTTDNGGAISI